MKRAESIIIAEAGLLVALSFVLSFLVVWEMPMGGSVSLEMVPLFLLAFRRGGKVGMLGGCIFGFLNLLRRPVVIHPLQFFLDYSVAFALVGLSGFVYPALFRGMVGIAIAVCVGGILRFFAHFVSGLFFFHIYAPAAQKPWVYSLIYNITYLLPEIVLSLIVVIALEKILRRSGFWR